MPKNTPNHVQPGKPMQRCHARAQGSGGRQCRNWPLPGQLVCRMHGGKSPQALAKAEDRMRALVHPALTRLAELITHADQDSVSLTATRYVLDWAGFRPTESDLTAESTPMHVTILFDRADQDPPPPALNGHSS